MTFEPGSFRQRGSIDSRPAPRVRVGGRFTMPFMTQLPAPGTADVFISYSHQNRAVAALLADVLAAQSLQVWWDRDLIAGTEFAGVIEAQLDGARVVVTLWSAESVRSAFVRDESARALRARKLLPLRIEDVELPLGFGQTHTLDLIGWDGDPQAANLEQLLVELRRRKGEPLARPAQPRRTDPAPPNWRRRAAVAALVAAPLGLAWVGKTAWDRRAESTRIAAERAEADRLFREGLAQQHAREPELVGAQNAYLSALELRPGHARARYYLGHVYAQRSLPTDALASFQLALAATEAPLDNSQRRDAGAQVKALAVDPAEAAPVARSVAAVSLPASAATTTPPPPPAPIVEPPGSRGLPRPAPAPAIGRPPRSDPPPATLLRLQPQIDAMFGVDPQQRISATTSLVVDPELLSDAVPLAVAQAQAVLARPRSTLAGADTSGVVNTLVLLQSALPGTLELNRGAITLLIASARSLGPTTRQHADKVSELLKTAAQRRPLAYLQIAAEAQRPIAQALALRFEAAGYESPPIEVVGNRAPARTEVRVQGKSERGFARWVTKLVTEAVEAEPRVSTLRAARPQADTYEIWLARDLCAPGGRALAACAGGTR